MVRMEVSKIPKFRKLTKTERILIAQWRNKGYSHKRITNKESLGLCLCFGETPSSWSPQQIAGRLRVDHPKDKSWWLCHETIYRFIYQPTNKKQAWWEYLRRKQIRRRKRQGRKSQRVRIPDRVSIHLRPEIINERKEVGHWEGDTFVGLGRRNGLHTAYERFSSLTRFEKMDSLRTKASLKAQMKIYQPFPEQVRKSTTLDNGNEHINHL